MGRESAPGVEVVLLSTGGHHAETGAGGPRLPEALAATGMHVRVCTRPLELIAAGLDDRSIVVIESAEADGLDRFVMASILQSMSRVPVVLCVGSDAEQRVRGLNSGADYCLSSPLSPAELASVVHALYRRLGERQPVAATAFGAAQHPDSWVLEYRACRLRAPAGPTLVLTGTECAFVLDMFRDGERVFRRDLWKANGAGDKRYDRRVDVIVSRIRRKANEADIELPLGAMRGVGYRFCAPCLVQDVV